jgi:hypothetical protein
LDEVEVSKPALAVGSEALPLTELLPAAAQDPAGWTALEAYGGGQRFALANPAIKHPRAEARQYIDDAGKVSMGLFNPVPPNTPQRALKARKAPTAGLRGVEKVVVRTQQRRSPVASPSAGAPVVVHRPGQARRPLSGRELAGLKVVPDPRGKSGGGWQLEDVIGLRFSDATPRTIALVRPDGSSESVDPELLDSTDRLVLLKHNREGRLRLQVFALDSPSAHPQAVYQDFERIELSFPDQ